MQHIVTFNGRPVSARDGETLFDAALSGAMLIPSDCSAGQCGCCRVKVVSGSVDDAGTREADTVLACQARVAGEANITFEPLPAPVKRAGRVTEVNTLSPEMIEVVVKLTAPLEYRPGQYVRAKFSGFPAREYSPTLRLDGTSQPDELIFQIRRVPGGVVSAELGQGIAAGLPVSVQGPFGTAYLRDDSEGPLVLVSGGSGWAPIWAVAKAARMKQRNRPVHVVAGARETANLYMQQSLQWLSENGVSVVGTAEQDAAAGVQQGLPTDFLPELDASHTVYVAGPPGLVDAVKKRAKAVHAQVYADPFVPNGRRASFVDRIARTWNGISRRRA